MESRIYQDISSRTGGDIYIGVVGPVRTGKSTFIKRFMETMVLPGMENMYRKEHARSIETVILRHWADSKEEKSSFKVLSLPSGLSGGPVAVPKGYSTDENVVNTSLDIKKLKLIDTVERTAFDGTSGVRTKDGYYALADQLGIYDTENRDFIATLQSAKSNYTKFALYANDTAEDGGKIRIITVSNK